MHFCRESVKVTFDKKEEEPEGDGEIKDDDETGEIEDQEKKVCIFSCLSCDALWWCNLVNMGYHGIRTRRENVETHKSI